MILGTIVEGYGEVEAAPVLLRRLAAWIAPGIPLEVSPPYRVKRQQIVKTGELERIVRFVGQRVGNGGVVILLDADDDCPAKLGPALLERARSARPTGPVCVVLAKREFEAWFLAACESLRGKRTLSADLQAPPDPESIRGAKEWLAARMVRGYVETLDQAAFAAEMDLTAAAAASRSFDKLVREMRVLLRRTPSV